MQYFYTLLNALPTELTDPNGDIIWHADYTLFGKFKRQQKRSYEVTEQNLRFAGQYYDAETGLHYNTLRYYAPECGRFTQQDPIGLAGGINLYQYAPNPLGWVDPLGLSCSPKKVKQLQTGPSSTVVYVTSKKEADELLKTAFSNFLKVKGIGHQKISGGNIKQRIKEKIKHFEEDGKAYHKDYALGPDGRPIMHKQGPEWHEYPHIDINRELMV